MRTSRFSQRITQIERIARERWVQPDPSQLHWEVLTPAEVELAQVLNDRIVAVDVAGLTDQELEDAICLQERLSGERIESCA